MKKILYMLFFIFLVLALTSCQSSSTDKTPNGNSTIQSPATSLLPNISEGINDAKTKTLMVYMLGSDLEAKAGAGTNDMTEMLESNVDLAKTNVVIFTGGSKHWHTEGITKEEHFILELTSEGFKTVTSSPLQSMGEPENLSYFLNYCYTNYSANEFSLIMWDHGDGPLIGYGKDMLFGNDSLTLVEMKTALENSPFSQNNKLAWVGFDACLMSSAELVCIWDDYANYLVASQEIEPAFGWNYAFLADYATLSTPDLLKKLTSDYLATCEAYYEKKGYDNRDTTLACMDLSKADELNDALNALFAKASSEVTIKYNELSSRRANTRALGRASTGSEYDLIDLNDMALQLSDIYPAEADKLQSVIREMVIANATNTDSCCGLSIYYPFYNKSYYEKDWSTVYSELGLFDEYLNYLNGYSKKWLGNDIITKIASSQLPVAATTNQYTLELTDEQNEAFTKARYHILRQEGYELYNRLFTSSNVTKQGNTLTANFDGNIIYVKDKFNQYTIPVSNEKDTVGDISRYTVYVGATNETAFMLDVPYEGWEKITSHHQYHLAINNKTKEITVSALVPSEASVDTQSLVGGKLVDTDLEQDGLTTFYFPHDRHVYITRLENGAIDGLANWDASDYYSMAVMNIRDDIQFEFEPLVSGKYFIIFEITDTQGNSFCSEPLPITSDRSFPAYDNPPVIESTWTNEDKHLIGEVGGVSLYLTIHETSLSKGYRLVAENHNDFDVAIKNNILCFNDSVYCPDGSLAYFSVPAGQTVEAIRNIDFGDAFDLQMTDMLESIQFDITIQNYLTKETLVFDQWFFVNLSEEKRIIQGDFWAITDYDYPVVDIKAEKQVLAEYEGCTIELLSIGGYDMKNSDVYVGLSFTNPTDEVLIVSIAGFTFDSTYIPNETGDITILPHSTVFKQLYIRRSDLDKNGITSASSLSIRLKFSEFATLQGGGGFSKVVTYPITLSASGSVSEFPSGKVIYDKDGIKLEVIGYKYDPDYPYEEWYIALTNTSGNDISIVVSNLVINGQSLPDNDYYNFDFMDAYAGNNERTVFDATNYNATTYPNEFSFKLSVMDFIEEKTLYTTDEVITLKSNS